MVLTVFAPRLARWRRWAFDMRERRSASNPANGGMSVAAIQTFLGTKGLTSTEVTAVTAGLTP